MTRTPFSIAELEDKLKVQISFIESSCKAFDSGNELESLRMAVVARVLFHNTRNSHALLFLLKKLSSLRLPNAGQPLPKGFHKPRPDGAGGSFRTSVGFRLCYALFPIDSGSMEFSPKVAEVSDGRTCAFSEWWNTPVLQAPGKSFLGPPREMARKDVVLGLANKEGGAHVDPNPSFEWWYTTRAGAFGRVYKRETGEVVWSMPMSELALESCPSGIVVTPVHATMRTIAEEILFVLKKFEQS